MSLLWHSPRSSRQDVWKRDGVLGVLRAQARWSAPGEAMLAVVRPWPCGRTLAPICSRHLPPATSSLVASPLSGDEAAASLSCLQVRLGHLTGQVIRRRPVSHSPTPMTAAVVAPATAATAPSHGTWNARREKHRLLAPLVGTRTTNTTKPKSSAAPTLTIVDMLNLRLEALDLASAEGCRSGRSSAGGSSR